MVILWYKITTFSCGFAPVAYPKDNIKFSVIKINDNVVFFNLKNIVIGSAIPEITTSIYKQTILSLHFIYYIKFR